MKKFYVVGFLFSEDYKKLVLIKKNKPEWQKGLLNGVGGKIELFDDSPLTAMKREFKEEAGVDISNWDEFLKLEGWDSVIFFYRATGNVELVKTVEDEEIRVIDLYDFYMNPSWSVDNLKWIVPLAMTHDNFKGQINLRTNNVTN